MKFEKTYRDFVNDIITEQGEERFSPTFLKMLQPKEKKKASEFQGAMKVIAQSFLQQLDDGIWDEFIEKLPELCQDAETATDVSGNTVIQLTKFQFMVSFFTYYFKVVFNNSITEIRNCIDKAAETLDIDEENYSKNTIRQIKSILSKPQKNKKVFVGIFNDLWGYGL